MTKIKNTLITILIIFIISGTAYSDIDQKGKVSSTQYMIEIKDKINTNRKVAFYVFCIEGYKFYSFSSWGHDSHSSSQFFVNQDGISVPAKCE